MLTSFLQDMLVDQTPGRRHSHVTDRLPGSSDGSPPPQSPQPDAITGLIPEDSRSGGIAVESNSFSLSPTSGSGLSAGSGREVSPPLSRQGDWGLSDPAAAFRAAAQRLSTPPQLSRPILDTEIFEAVAPLSSATTTAVTTVPSPLLVQGVGSNLAFRISWDTSVGSAPAAFSTTIGSVAQWLANNLTSAAPVTINLQVGWGSLNNSTLPAGALGASSNYLYSYGSSQAAYSAFRSKLAAVSSGSVIDSQVLTVAAPIPSPLSSGGMYFTSAQAKAIRAISGAQTSLDGFVGFANTNYLQTSGSGYDLIGVAQHEFTEAMGRIMLSGTKFGTVSAYTSSDLMHFAAPGVRMLTTKGGYLSANGINKLAYLNPLSYGDAADLASPTATQPNLGIDALNAFASPGATTFATNDWFTMDSLGWNLTPASGLTPQSVPSYLA